MIDLYYWPTPNGKKVTIFLEEIALPYNLIPLDIGRGDQFSPDFLKINPNHRMPAIVDHAPLGGGDRPISVFESGAILIYLGEKSGRFWPSGLRAQVPVLEWLMWQVGGFGPAPGQVHHFLQVENEQDRRYGLDRFLQETRRLYGVLDKRLAAVEFVAGALSIADFAIVAWAWRHERHQVDLADYPNVRRWYDALMARPAVRRGFDVALS
jgi:GST-like protein